MGNNKSTAAGARQLRDGLNVMKVNLLQPPDNLPISVDVIRDRAQAICTLSHSTGTVKAVMVAWEGLHCIVTYASSSNLTSCNIDVELTAFGKPENKIVRLNSEELLTLYCPLAEIVIIKLEPEVAQDILDYGCKFMQLPSEENASAANNSQVFLCNSLDKNIVKINCGALKEHYGLDIEHNAAWPDINVTGLPVLSEHGQLLGIQKCIQSSSTEPQLPPTSLAVSMSVLISSHFPLIAAQLQQPGGQLSIITNPVIINEAENTDLNGMGLEKCVISKQKYTECNFYVSPAEKYITPIWFMPTCIGWYWTPTDPDSNGLDCNWMPVSVLAVVGGMWREQIPAAKNCKIIRSLQKKEDERKNDTA